MRHQYVIDPEIQALLPPLTPEERAQLRGRIVVSQHCDDLVVLHIGTENKNVLGDGHNREEICNEEGVPFKTRLEKVPDRPAALAWVISNQLGRRNLTDERRSYYRGKDYLNTKQPHGGQLEGMGQNVPSAEAVGEKHGVSGRTVKRDAEFAAAVDELPPKEKEAVLSGTSGKTKTEVVNGKKPTPLLCETCRRKTPGVGIPDCPMCKEARKKRETGRKGKGKGSGGSKKNGRAVWDWKPFEKAFGALVREVDRLAGAYKAKTAKEGDALRKQLSAFKAGMVAWHKTLSTEAGK